MISLRQCIAGLLIVSALLLVVLFFPVQHTVPSIAEDPVTLSIPRLSIDAPVIRVGLTKTGAMDAPALASQVGWFSLGTKPGQAGNAVLDGHLDTILDTHGVFWNLSALAPGDDVYVLDAQKRALHFRVSRSVSYPADAVPMQNIFGTSSGTHLNLITCAGSWSGTSGGYAKRLVVFTDLIR